jgi:hypothetical protein
VAEKYISYKKALELLYRPRSFIFETCTRHGREWQVVVDNGRQRGGLLKPGDAHRLLGHPQIKARADGLFGTSQTYALRTST